MSNVAAVTAILVHRREQALVDFFRKNNALSIDSALDAKKFASQKIDVDLSEDFLKGHRFIIQTKTGKYYLSESQYSSYTSSANVIGCVVIVVIIMCLLWVLLV